jgi:steroid 5-alpha reductase family enzyme
MELITIDGWIFLYAFAGVFGLSTILYIIAQIKRNNGIIDIFWSIFSVVAVYISFIVQFVVIKTTEREGYLTQVILVILVTIWGFRLSYHIARRNIGKPEDKRYARFREVWKKNFYLRVFFSIFMMQALWAAIIISPVVFTNSLYETAPLSTSYWSIGSLKLYYPEKLIHTVPIILGGLVWILGFFFEAVGDRQLKNFIRNPDNKGKIIESGLWKYTRHPNYFGEITMSWGMFLIALRFVNTNPLILVTAIGPLLYTLLIRYVTGVPPLEKYLITKPGFKEYMERTSVLIPWFSKKKKGEKKD